MNWKLLLVIAGLTLTTSLTACSKKDDAAAPDATKTETTKTETTETKPADAPKGDAKPADSMAPKSDAKPADGMKPADAPKGDTTKTTKTETTKPADAPKKPQSSLGREHLPNNLDSQTAINVIVDPQGISNNIGGIVLELGLS